MKSATQRKVIVVMKLGT